MKKTGLLLILCWAIASFGQSASPAADQPAPDATQTTRVNFPIERMMTPTYSDLYCAGFVSKQALGNTNYVMGGLDTPNTTQYALDDIIYLSGKGYELGKQYTIVRELRDPNRRELFTGQDAMLKAMGQPYAELGIVRVIDLRHKTAIGHVEFSCAPIVPGDFAIPYADKAPIPHHDAIRFDRFLPSSGKLSGRIVLAKEFDSELGSGAKIYMNVGTNQGVKVGDYFRAFRAYEADLHNPVDSLSFKASAAEDTQMKPPSMEQGMFSKTSGPSIHVADFPRRSIGEIVVVEATPTTSTGMIVFALEDVHLGDGVESDPQ